MDRSEASANVGPIDLVLEPLTLLRALQTLVVGSPGYAVTFSPLTNRDLINIKDVPSCGHASTNLGRDIYIHIGRAQYNFWTRRY